MQEQIDQVTPIIHSNRERQRANIRPDQPREFQCGDQVLPNASCKVLAHLQCPYIIFKRVGSVNYHLEQPGKHAHTQLYHVNLLKKWLQPAPVLSAFSVDPQSPTSIPWATEERTSPRAATIADRTG